MKRSLPVALCCFLALVAVAAAQADNPNKAAAALKRSSVYIAPGTPGTDSDTEGELSGLLNDGDNIAVVMLPDGAASGDPSDFARSLNQKLGGKKIIGLMVGNQAVAYSALLPAGVADELMHSAANVSTNPVETLTTFIQNVHNWQAQNPAAVASKPAKPAKKKSGGFPWWVLGVVLGVAAIAVVAFATRAPKRGPVSGEEVVKFHSPVKSDLEQIADMRRSIRDPELRKLLTQVCTDVEAYFRKYCTNPEDDAGVFRRHLRDLRKVLEKYIDVQDSPARYYDNPQRLMQSGYKAVEGFAQYILDSIRRGSRADLTEFQVKTDILSAKKYSNA